MTKDDLLKNIAETGYNVGFGAKKNLATFDIVSKVPGAVGFIFTAVGIIGLAYEEASVTSLSVTLTILGVLALTISIYDHKKQLYADTGGSLTKLFSDLKTLYYKVKPLKDDDNLSSHIEELSALEKEYSELWVSGQIMFSDWYAHYKFFWQNQIEWVDEQKNFKLLRDKLPLSFTLSLALLIVTSIACLICKWDSIFNFIKNICDC